MKNIAVIGGGGFVGSYIARTLSSKYLVKIVDISPPPKNLTELDNIEYRFADIRCYDSILSVLNDVDLVIHAAVIQIPKINEEKRLGYETNVLGTHNVARAVDKIDKIKGMILIGSWHVLGEFNLEGTIDESFGYRPDKVEDRARLYAFSKIMQEIITRFHEEFSEKIYFVIRPGTVLGEGMPEKTAANMFILNALQGKPITPYKHSMYRPMFYVDISDLTKVLLILVEKIIAGLVKKSKSSLDNVMTVAYPEPITILELAHIVSKLVTELTNGAINAPIQTVDTEIEPLYLPEDKYKIKISLEKLFKKVGVINLTNPQDTLKRIILLKLNNQQLTMS